MIPGDMVQVCNASRSMAVKAFSLFPGEYRYNTVSWVSAGTPGTVLQIVQTIPENPTWATATWARVLIGTNTLWFHAEHLQKVPL